MTDLNEVLSEEEFGGLTSKYATVEDLAKAYQGLDKTLSSSFRVPGQDAGQDEWGKFYTRLGAPESTEGYTLPETEDTALKDTLGQLRASALETGITQKQWTALARKANEVNQTSRTAVQDQISQMRENWQAALKTELGDTYEDTLAHAQRLHDQVFGEDEELQALFQTLGIADHPAIVRMFAEVAKRTGNDQIPQSLGGQMDPASNIREQIREWHALARSEAAKDNRHWEHVATKKRMLDLMKIFTEQKVDPLNPDLAPNPMDFMKKS